MNHRRRGADDGVLSRAVPVLAIPVFALAAHVSWKGVFRLVDMAAEAIVA